MIKKIDDFHKNPLMYIKQFINAHVASSKLNLLTEIDGSAIFEEPLIGVANGYNPLFEEYKNDKHALCHFHLYIYRQALVLVREEL